MRIGTFRCWLFGHVFIKKSSEMQGLMVLTRKFASDYCIRCGIGRPQGDKAEGV